MRSKRRPRMNLRWMCMRRDDDPRRVEEVLDRLEMVGRAKSVTIETMTEALGERSYGPFLLIPALLDISPLGSIPGVPSAWRSSF